MTLNREWTRHAVVVILIALLALGAAAKVSDPNGWSDPVGVGAVCIQGGALALLVAGRSSLGSAVALVFYSAACASHFLVPQRGCSCLGAFARKEIRLELLVAAVGGLCAAWLLRRQTALTMRAKAPGNDGVVA